MSAIKNLSGRKFGKLTVSSNLKRTRWGTTWECVCACGTRKYIRAGHLLSGKIKSCRCMGFSGDGSRTHGKTKTPTYRAWLRLRARCYDKNNIEYRRYGGRGISVCDRWRTSFSNFLADMGERPSEGHSVDRINNNGNYDPSNCRWATHREQQNNKRSNLFLTYDGITLTAAQWNRKQGFGPGRVNDRLKRGWSLEKALLTPI